MTEEKKEAEENATGEGGEEKLDVEKDVVEDVPEEEKETRPEIKIDLDAWHPRTSTGKKVKSGEITDIDQILDKGIPILEEQIVDVLLPGHESELLMIGQSKGKFGGGAKRIFRQTQKKTPEGNKPSFACMAVVGNKNGYVGIGYGKSKDTVPAREKAIRNAKLNLFKIRRGSGSWEDRTEESHSIPWKVTGKCSSVATTLFPAPKGKGLVCEQEVAKILVLAGIENVYSKTRGRTRSKVNMIAATVDALEKLNTFKARPGHIKNVHMVEGKAQ